MIRSTLWKDLSNSRVDDGLEGHLFDGSCNRNTCLKAFVIIQVYREERLN